MHRIKNQKVKREMPESSSTPLNDNEEHDLAYYIHDRVELMHQVFSVIKPKELKAMAPECVQHISIDDLQELCTEELLGISSKRLCAILDGAEPPSDTESSASEQMETISLDSISSDDEILSQTCTKNKKRKHKKHKSKEKHKRKDSDSSDQERDEVEDRSKASRAGLTVLELLELQARARAIRAQLQQDNINMPAEQSTNTEKNDSSDEVEIKEEPPDVVEISSEDEKPNIEDLNVKALQQKESPPQEDTQSNTENSTTVKRINNLIITVPQTKPSRKIKLKRNKIVTVSNNTITKEKDKTTTDKSGVCNIVSENTSKTLSQQKCNESVPNTVEQSKGQNKARKKQKKKSKKIEKDGSDHDEITLQLSDTEKMDLLEDLNRKDYDSFTSSDSKDSENSSSSDSDSITKKSVKSKGTDTFTALSAKVIENDTSKSLDNDKQVSEQVIDLVTDCSQGVEKQEIKSNNIGDNSVDTETISCNNKNELEITEKVNNIQQCTETNPGTDTNHCDADVIIISSNIADKASQAHENEIENNDNNQDSNNKEQVEEGEIINNVEINEDLSEGEVSDKNNLDMVPSSEIVCISDEENKIIKNSIKKKKQKKSKKEKKIKKSKQDFCESSDQNFFKDDSSQNTDKINLEQQSSKQSSDNVSFEDCENIITIYDDDNDILEILELSDDSDTEGNSVLSKEPTTAEIVALSAKIDEIDNVDSITKSNEDNSESVENDNEVENISWRDRYLGSKKVKKVLTTASILNALRKKNKELKTKLGVAKKASIETTPPVSESSVLVEGSIEHFNTLQGSTKYVDPIVGVEECNKNKENSESKVTKEMEKDAKMLLKMYKKLLKYNDMNKQKDPNKKKKKKQKRNKDKEKIKNLE